MSSSLPTTVLSPPVRPRWRTGGTAFFTGPGLPIFLASAAGVYEVFLLLVIFAPAGWGAWSAFAEEFKIWCFNYDPRTGGLEWMAVVIMLAEPVFIVGLLLGIWGFGRPAHRPRTHTFRPHLRAALAGLGVGGLAVAGLYAYGRPAAEPALLPFPGERIRTQLVAPDFSLKDQRGLTVNLADLRGRVTLVTGVYALCSTACPEILLQARELIAGLPPENRARFQMVALSLNPEYDTPELMGAVADTYGLPHPEFRYLNGDPATMHPLLRDFQFAARRNPDTGLVDHANLFILLDAEGRIAYRFNLDRRHRDWLRAAVLMLTAEAASMRS